MTVAVRRNLVGLDSLAGHPLRGKKQLPCGQPPLTAAPSGQFPQSCPKTARSSSALLSHPASVAFAHLASRMSQMVLTLALSKAPSTSKNSPRATYSKCSDFSTTARRAVSVDRPFLYACCPYKLDVVLTQPPSYVCLSSSLVPSLGRMLNLLACRIWQHILSRFGNKDHPCRPPDFRHITMRHTGRTFLCALLRFSHPPTGVPEICRRVLAFCMV